jgi:hypothetical protein
MAPQLAQLVLVSLMSVSFAANVVRGWAEDFHKQSAVHFVADQRMPI